MVNTTLRPEALVTSTAPFLRASVVDSSASGSPLVARDPRGRDVYAGLAVAAIPRLFGQIDRNPHRATYGCLDREFWHYRTSSFPSGMYQEGALPLALAYLQAVPGNHWQGQPVLRELAIAAVLFAARSSHADGSCDDYYPHERALGATVFSLLATARRVRLLEIDLPEVRAWLVQRGRWVSHHQESGRLTNHHALAACGLAELFRITGLSEFRQAAVSRIEQVLGWQSEEGWFAEYGGADPGYQTVTLDCLASLEQDFCDVPRLSSALEQGTRFARWFLHPDDSYGGEYGSRGTSHFYPCGFERLAARNSAAADLADGFLRSVRSGTATAFEDDRMYLHRLANWFDAWRHWSPVRPQADDDGIRAQSKQFPLAGLVVHREPGIQTIVSLARGGVFKHFSNNNQDQNDPGVWTDTGLVVETTSGRLAVSQLQSWPREPGLPDSDPPRPPERDRPEAAVNDGPDPWCLQVRTQLCWVQFETQTPLKQALFHAGMLSAGRWLRTWVRKALQRRLISGRRTAPIVLTRTIERVPTANAQSVLRVTDALTLTDAKTHIRRLSRACDLQAVYVAASNVYQRSCLQGWEDLSGHVAELNRDRAVTIVREYPLQRAECEP